MVHTASAAGFTWGLQRPKPAAQLLERNNSDCSREARGSWARLIRKICETDPLLCFCSGRMRIISFIADPRVADRILLHLKSPHSKA